ncbi:MAG TPA: hypothetical protein VFV10_05900 [Gammaproteobacteria bacterium]|nr:hypothetical protein [Gammaproteobacteria bacterium]
MRASRRHGPANAIRAGIGGVLATVLTAVSAADTRTLEDFEGVWSGYFTTQDNEFWNVEDLPCFPGCSAEWRAKLTALLDDPANDSKPTAELVKMAGDPAEQIRAILTPLGKRIQDANNSLNDPKLHCEPYGFVREATSPLPMRIERDGENLLIQYEEWSLTRTIYMDGRPHPDYQTPTLLGHSVGKIEDGALVVRTARVNPNWISDATHAGHSGELEAVERYTIRDNPRRLELELTIEDPVVLEKPYVIAKTWLATPDVKLLIDSCKDLPGKPDL